ncbi:MAG: LysM peptidoglycan-binding domain-containing protein, partial [Candidatus Roseilinea sp.]|uniref:LysM peptidoglycan-binding domain-containing protein n=1 Tax=Candidatus Roseilinea sp. TaxID=2838777 RepID=UPI0040498721
MGKTILCAAATLVIALSGCAVPASVVPNTASPAPPLPTRHVGDAGAATAPTATATAVPSPTPTWPAPINATPTPDPPRNIPTETTVNSMYTVRRGDTLSGIAAAVGATVEE